MIGKGIGAALMTECLMRARSSGCDAIWLGVWEKNQRAIHFYERWGFSIVGERGFKLGSDMQNDLIMSKRLSREDG
jgi:ribosomal protein S18 acetylase RimI-like enzyme